MIHIKSKSFTALCLFVFITIHDSYGVITDGNSQQETHSQQSAENKEMCIAELEKNGYVGTSSEPKSGLDLYLELFNFFTKSEEFNNYDKEIEEKVSTCILHTSKEPFGYLKFFFCDIIVHVYYLVDIKNAELWCKGKGEHHDIIKGLVTREAECWEELKLAGFIFKHGLDNYAYLIKKEKNNQVAHNEEISFSGDYIQYLILEVSQKEHNLENAKKWCNNNECDMALYAEGFTDRYSGEINRKAVQNYCRQLLQVGLLKDYCTYLMNKGSNFYEVENQELLGTHGWCLLRAKKTESPEVNQAN